MRPLTGFDALADERGFVVVYPEGWNEMWQADDDHSYDSDDVEFVRALLDEIQHDLAIDPSRIYAVGFSNGAFFINRLACHLSDRVAAFGGVSGAMSEALHDPSAPCTPSAPVPMVFVHGSEDPIQPFHGKSRPPFVSAPSMTVPDTIAFGVGVNGCEPTPIASDLPDIPDDGTQVTKEIYGDCQAGAEVMLYVIEGGGHTWPGNMDYVEDAREIGVGLISADLDASAALWEFVSKFLLP